MARHRSARASHDPGEVRVIKVTGIIKTEEKVLNQQEKIGENEKDLQRRGAVIRAQSGAAMSTATRSTSACTAMRRSSMNWSVASRLFR